MMTSPYSTHESLFFPVTYLMQCFLSLTLLEKLLFCRVRIPPFLGLVELTFVQIKACPLFDANTVCVPTQATKATIFMSSTKERWMWVPHPHFWLLDTNVKVLINVFASYLQLECQFTCESSWRLPCNSHRCMWTTSGWPVSEKEAASASWPWYTAPQGRPLLEPRPMSSCGASTETVTGEYSWWGDMRQYLWSALRERRMLVWLHAFFFFAFPLTQIFFPP